MSDRDDQQGRTRSPLDVLTLLAGIATLLVSGYILLDAEEWFEAVDLRWALAGGAVVVGLLMLVASMRPRKDGR